MGALVGILMGSDSDWPLMEAAADTLEDFGIEYEADVLSAHRMTAETLDYAQSAEARGIRIIIAGAGGAAHLPGVIAAVTPLPVIGVPIPLKQLDGMDSLLSIVQMPAGVPVATVGIGNAKNAALLAVRMLSTANDDFGASLRRAIVEYQADLKAQAMAKGEIVRQRSRKATGV